MNIVLTHDCKIIEVPTKAGTSVDLVVDADFDESVLSGVIFEELYNSIVVYKRNGVYRNNHTKVGSMSELFGFSRGSKRHGKKYLNDYTTAAWLKNNVWQYNFVSEAEAEEVADDTWFGSFVRWVSKPFVGTVA